MQEDSLIIDNFLVRRLLTSQFPCWQDLCVEPVKISGWDNRTFRLGQTMLVRLPSAEQYACQVEKEHAFLPKLALGVSLPIPVPLAMGEPAYGYPWKWSVYKWIEGETIPTSSVNDLVLIAKSLAFFLRQLHLIDTAKGPLAGFHSFYRGGALSTYDADTKKAICVLKGKIDTNLAMHTW